MKFAKCLLVLFAILSFSWFGFSLTADAALVDSDGDGIPDIIETNGIRDAQGHVLVDLKAMGADPHHKDLFVQCDWMDAQDHSHRPKPEAIRKVVEAFAHAPVSNPDGQQGIHLHVDAGPESVMDFHSGATWGELGAGKEVPHTDMIGKEDAQDNYDWSALDAIKKQTMPEARMRVFRYCLWGHNYTASGSSGMARDLPSDDLLVTLGNFEGQEGTVLEQTGTFMHEFGHALGLRHGGSDDVNYKPNFFSIMSYSYQFEGLRINGLDGTFDFSRQAIPPLNEQSLDVNKGVPGAPSDHGVRWRVLVDGQAVDRVVDTPAHVDWTQTGQTMEKADINADNEISVLDGTPNEWGAISYTGTLVGDWTGVPMAGGATSGKMKTAPRFTHDKEHLTKKDADLIHMDYEVSTVMSEEVTGAPGATVVLHLTITNEGKKDDTYTIGHARSGHWADTSKLPAQVMIPAGQSRKFDIPVHIAADAHAEAHEMVDIQATSKANPNVIDEAQGTVVVKH